MRCIPIRFRISVTVEVPSPAVAFSSTLMIAEVQRGDFNYTHS
jgi:hypothetical protein